MRRDVLFTTLMGVVLGGVCHAEHVSQTTGVSEVIASDRAVISIATKIRYTTMIILPDTEEIVDVLCGDKEFWVIAASHNIAHVKPAKEGAATNLNLVTTSGTVYSFLLAESKAAPDLKLYVTADPDGAPKPAKYYAAKDVSELQVALADARTAIEAVQHRTEETLADFRKSYHSTLQFAYATPPYVKPFFVKSIWHDDRSTYIKSDAQELPALYEVTDGGAPALVNFQVENGTYIVPKVLDRGYLAIGNKKLEFQTRGR
jgi:type IV secretion system protein VirB9